MNLMDMVAHPVVTFLLFTMWFYLLIWFGLKAFDVQSTFKSKLLLTAICTLGYLIAPLFFSWLSGVVTIHYKWVPLINVVMLTTFGLSCYYPFVNVF